MSNRYFLRAKIGLTAPGIICTAERKEKTFSLKVSLFESVTQYIHMALHHHTTRLRPTTRVCNCRSARHMPRPRKCLRLKFSWITQEPEMTDAELCKPDFQLGRFVNQCSCTLTHKHMHAHFVQRQPCLGQTQRTSRACLRRDRGASEAPWQIWAWPPGREREKQLDLYLCF